MISTASSSRRILVVEDQHDSRESLRALLELWGYQVECAPDGRVGVEKALCWRPDVVVLDIGLPGIDGYDVAQHVRTGLGGDVLLIAWTGYDSREDHRQTYDAGFDFHVAKASDPEILQQLLAR
jgi:CheY-like chemotaxis protein